jgi:hypothetical protein
LILRMDNLFAGIRPLLLSTRVSVPVSYPASGPSYRAVNSRSRGGSYAVDMDAGDMGYALCRAHPFFAVNSRAARDALRARPRSLHVLATSFPKRLFQRENRLTTDRGISTMCRLSEGFPSGQRDQTVNLTRELRWFESTPLHHNRMI